MGPPSRPSSISSLRRSRRLTRWPHGSQFALLVNHDDADREFAYTKAAEKSVASAASWLDGREHDERLDHGVRERRRAMTDPTAIDLRLNSTLPRSTVRPAVRRMIRAATPASRRSVG
jgi:hypothetical protein